MGSWRIKSVLDLITTLSITSVFDVRVMGLPKVKNMTYADVTVMVSSFSSLLCEIFCNLFVA